MSNPITEGLIHEALRSKTFGRWAICFDTIDSTNRFAKHLAAQGRPEGTLVYAEQQTAGRGRWSRTWDSPRAQGLWFSLVLRPKKRCRSLTCLMLLGATSVARALEQAAGLKVLVKWPNDIYVQGKKLAGILTEVSQNQHDVLYAVMGIGVNVTQNEADFPADIREKAISLNMVTHTSHDRLALLIDLLVQLENDYRKAETNGFDFVLNRWVSRSFILGKEVLIRLNSHSMKGVVRAFHSNGDIVLATDDGREHRFSDGEIIEVRDVVGCGCR